MINIYEYFSNLAFKFRIFTTRSYMPSNSKIKFHRSVRFDRWCYFTARGGEIFIDENWNFFHDNSETGGANMDISVLNDIVYREYGNYIRNLFVSKCGYSRF